MAARGHYTRGIILISLFLLSPISDAHTSFSSMDLRVLDFQDLPEILKESCILAVDVETSPIHYVVQELFHAFSNEPLVKIVKLVNLLNVKLKRSEYSPEKPNEEADHGESLPLKNVVFFPRRRVERKCLLSTAAKFQPLGEQLSSSLTAKNLLSFLNSRCGSFRELNGTLNSLGRRREFILNNLFKVPTLTDQQHSDPRIQVSSHCDEINLPSKEEFIHKYLYRSKPVVIKGMHIKIIGQLSPIQFFTQSIMVVVVTLGKEF